MLATPEIVEHLELAEILGVRSERIRREHDEIGLLADFDRSLECRIAPAGARR
jgi:hypothetical protein